MPMTCTRWEFNSHREWELWNVGCCAMVLVPCNNKACQRDIKAILLKMALTTDTCYHHLNEQWFVEKGDLNKKKNQMWELKFTPYHNYTILCQVNLEIVETIYNVIIIWLMELFHWIYFQFKHSQNIHTANLILSLNAYLFPWILNMLD